MEKIVIYLFLLFFCSTTLVAHGFVASSANYRIESDSINVGGTEDSSSASYNLRDTVGEIGTGLSNSTSYNLKAGYRQMLEPFISISTPANVTLTPSISGVTGGIGSGTATWTVITDASAGYTVSVKVDTDPALQSGGNTFANYAEVSAGTPDYTFTVAATDSEFGFSPEGADITSTIICDSYSYINCISSSSQKTKWQHQKQED